MLSLDKINLSTLSDEQKVDPWKLISREEVSELIHILKGVPHHSKPPSQI